jgi:hypothetical protein
MENSNTMNLACTVIPTYEHHFNYTLSALKSYNENINGDLYLIFSNNSEYELFKSKTTEKFNHLILENPFTAYENIINAKKIYAVHQLANKYKYIGVIDTEVDFIKKYDEFIEYKNIFESKEFKSNISTQGNKILSPILDIMDFDEYNTSIILKETDNLKQYWWFNELSVYESETFYEFFDWLKSHKNFISMMSVVYCFDYFIYSIWLIVFNGFKLKKICQTESFKFGAIEECTNIEVIDQFESMVSKISESTYTKIVIQKDR